MMKKMIFTPKRDSITICLPPEWVGKPLICILKDPSDTTDEEIVSEVSENALCYQTARYRRKSRERRPRTRHLRRYL